MSKFQVGQTWRAKKPANAGGLVNDRVIRWVSSTGEVQYDGPAVAFGRHYPKVSGEVFEKWAGRELQPGDLPEGEWQTWDWKKPNGGAL